MEVKIYKLNWRWWWDQSEDYSINYLSRNNQKVVLRKNINIRNGKAALEIDGKQLDWGRHLVVIKDPVSGHTSGQVFYMSWWGSQQANGLGASFLTLQADKTDYQVGETVQIDLPSSVSGKALVTIENGSKVLQSFWVETTSGRSGFSFDLSAEMTPNIYVNVTLLQPHVNTGNDLPIRLYGILPLKTYDPNTLLNPKIAMADELRPGEEVTISVTEDAGRPMAYTVAVVDEGLLDITNFKTPGPMGSFQSKRSTGRQNVGFL